LGSPRAFGVGGHSVFPLLPEALETLLALAYPRTLRPFVTCSHFQTTSLTSVCYGDESPIPKDWGACRFRGSPCNNLASLPWAILARYRPALLPPKTPATIKLTHYPILIAKLALKRWKSVDFTGYWQRHIQG
jgi:hypothetical protein